MNEAQSITQEIKEKNPGMRIKVTPHGVREIGGANSALLSLFEPITSVVFSVLLLGDVLSVSKVLGSLLIMGSLVLITLNSKE